MANKYFYAPTAPSRWSTASCWFSDANHTQSTTVPVAGDSVYITGNYPVTNVPTISLLRLDMTLYTGTDGINFGGGLSILDNGYLYIGNVTDAENCNHYIVCDIGENATVIIHGYSEFSGTIIPTSSTVHIYDHSSFSGTTYSPITFHDLSYFWGYAVGKMTFVDSTYILAGTYIGDDNSAKTIIEWKSTGDIWRDAYSGGSITFTNTDFLLYKDCKIFFPDLGSLSSMSGGNTSFLPMDRYVKVIFKTYSGTGLFAVDLNRSTVPSNPPAIINLNRTQL
jgi:hypothetical protein